MYVTKIIERIGDIEKVMLTFKKVIKKSFV